MALKKCKECGNEISSKAEACPQCGAPQKKKTSIVTWFVLILILFGVVGAIFDSLNTPRDAGPSAYAKLDKSLKKQAERKEFIEKLIRKGILYKLVTPGEIPHIYVAPGFYSLNVDDKQSFISVVYAYCLAHDSRVNIVALYDSKSGKNIGSFNEGGLKLD